MMPEFALLRAFNRMREAVCRADRHALGGLLASDYRGVDVRGCVSCTEAVVDGYGLSLARIEKYRIADLEVHVFGDVGLVTGLAYLSGGHGNGSFHHRLRFCTIFLHRSSRWELFFMQCTKLSNEATTAM